MITTRWKYDHTRTTIFRFRDGFQESCSIEAPRYLELLASGYEFDEPDPPVDPGPTMQERVEAAETIIDLLLMEGE